MALAHLTRTAAPEAVAAAVAADGAVIVDGLAPLQLMERIGEELRPWLADTPVGPDDFSGRLTRRTGALIARSTSSRELIMHPLALATTALVLSHATNFQLHLTQAIAIGPGQGPQPLHRDRWAFDFFPFPHDYEVQCNIIWALTDFTEENGATRVVPGSNRAEDGVIFAASDTVPAEMERGSALFYSGSVYHGGGANQAETTRVGVNITYNVAWLRQEENQYISVPKEVAETLPVDLLRLMGVCPGRLRTGLHRRSPRSDRGHSPGIRVCGLRRRLSHRGSAGPGRGDAGVTSAEEVVAAPAEISRAGARATTTSSSRPIPRSSTPVPGFPTSPR